MRHKRLIITYSRSNCYFKLRLFMQKLLTSRQVLRCRNPLGRKQLTMLIYLEI